MNNKWPAGQAAFITGAASGIGLGIARALVARGAHVALTDVNADSVRAAAEELCSQGAKAIGIPLDVSNPDQWVSAADQAEAALGPVSILCNNAGVSGGAELDQTLLSVWRWVHQINVDGPFLGISTFLPRFKQRGGRAHIVNTSSMVGIVPMTRVGAYSSSKFACTGMTMVLRDELKGTDIGVSLLCPGNVATRIAHNSGIAQAELMGQTADMSAITSMAMISAQGANPDNIGQQVVEAMENRDFLIFTHSEWQPLISQLHAEIQQAIENVDGRHGVDVSALSLVQGLNPISASAT